MRDMLTLTRPETSSQKRCDQQQGHHTCECPFRWRRSEQPPKKACLFRQTVTQVQPCFFFKACGRLGNLQWLDLLEHRLHACKLRTTLRARGQMAFYFRCVFCIAVIMQHDLFFAEMVHFTALPPHRAPRVEVPGPA